MFSNLRQVRRVRVLDTCGGDTAARSFGRRVFPLVYRRRPSAPTQRAASSRHAGATSRAHHYFHTSQPVVVSHVTRGTCIARPSRVHRPLENPNTEIAVYHGYYYYVVPIVYRTYRKRKITYHFLRSSLATRNNNMRSCVLRRRTGLDRRFPNFSWVYDIITIIIKFYHFFIP